MPDVDQYVFFEEVLKVEHLHHLLLQQAQLASIQPS